jgi:hypothetical protein
VFRANSFGIRQKGLLAFAFLSCVAVAQEAPAPAKPETKPSSQTPPIKLNIMNVCTPPDAEKQEIVAALAKIPAKAVFSSDFEVTRGRASTPGADPARYVRLRRELTGDPIFNIVQYSLSADPKEIQEILVFKAKDPKDLLLISIEDNISATAAAPGTALETDTPASHIKLERFGKASLGLARCESADQSAYESIFSDASKVIASYRKALGLRSMFRTELSWLSTAPKDSAAKSVSAKKAAGKTEKADKTNKPAAASSSEPKK